MAFDCRGKSALGKVAWEELTKVIVTEGQVLLDLLHYYPENRAVRALEIP